MKYLIDTSVWSLALRKKGAKDIRLLSAIDKLNMLLEHGERIFLLGIILQEILQGIKKRDDFSKVSDSLSYFPVIEASKEDYIFAAELFNHCQSKGVQASTVDFLIASISINHDCRLLTTDKDFQHIAKHTELNLF